MVKQYLEAGRVVGTHGVRGELRVEPWCDSAQFLCQFKTLYWENGATPVRVISSRPHKNILLLMLEGIDSATAGDTLRGRILYLNRKDAKLPKGSWFVQDMLGLSVCDADTGVCYGTLTDVLQTGANDVYQVTSPQGKEYLVPSIPHVVVERNLEEGKMLIRPLRGVFEDED